MTESGEGRERDVRPPDESDIFDDDASSVVEILYAAVGRALKNKRTDCTV